jgi:cobyrinic acid a,c-diamide synthase
VRDADVAILEGVMGLYDGASPTGDEGSTAEIAKWLAAPVVLVCDASGMARSIAALGRGFATYDPDLNVAGLIANRIGSRGHLDLLCRATGVPRIYGGLPKEPSLTFPERHLGLRTADREAIADDVFAAWGARVAEWVDVDAIETLARAAPPGPDAPVTVACDARRRCRIGIAFDDAFHFYYDDNLRRLADLGAELVRFSPVHDAHLPAVDGLYFGGGYPEVHAAALARNTSMIADVAAFAGPIYGECGGLMYLARGIRTLDGTRHPMVGRIPGEARMRERLQALGYVEVETQEATILGGPGLRFRGHQFRYSDLELGDEVACAYTVRKRRGGDASREGYRAGNVLASYVHAHWASNPLVAHGFVRACEGRGR